MHICFSLSIFKNLLFLLIFFNVFTVIDNEKIKKKEKKKCTVFQDDQFIISSQQ
jgi:hypothetical protein